MKKRPSSNQSDKSSTSSRLETSEKNNFFHTLKIGTKLSLGFGILVLLTFLSAGISYLGSARTTAGMNRIDEIRVPTTLAASRAQADLLRILASVRGYLALGDAKYRSDYELNTRAFEKNLTELDELAPHLDAVNRGRLRDLNSIYHTWIALPGKIFLLHDNQLEREPAYQMLVQEGLPFVEIVLRQINTSIDIQGTRAPSPENIDLLWKMAKFQGSFAEMISALRGYVGTRDQQNRNEYMDRFKANQLAWQELQDRRHLLTSSQQEGFKSIEKNRAAFMRLPEQMFAILGSEHWREDWYMFTQKAVPYADIMQQLLAEMTETQHDLLSDDVRKGKKELASVTQQILTSGCVALLLGILMAVLFQRQISGPIRRLTATAELIRGGAPDTLAYVETQDEIGILAKTFNRMTSQLRQTLAQIKKEKKRADDLLEVVIPIGVQLSSEKNFHRLLEKMLLEAKTFCRADAGTLYLRTEDEQLQFMILRNDSKNLAMGGTSGQAIPFAPLPLNKEDVTSEKEHQLRYIATQVVRDGVSRNIAHYHRQSEILPDYRVESLLTIPLKSSLGDVRGVLQLLNAQDPESKEYIPFDAHLQQMMESFSLLAVAALEAYIREQSLKHEIRQLRVEIDEVKRRKQVQQIVETETFQSLREKAAAMRQRRTAKQQRRQILPEDDNS